MKKRIFIALFFVFVIALGLLLIQSLKQNKPDTAELKPKQERKIRIISQAEVDEAIKAQATERKKQMAYIRKIEADKDFAESELKRLIAENPQAKKMARLVKSATLPITFYGRVVDSNSAPISDVEIHYSIAPAFGIGQPAQGNTKSNNEGIYTVKGEGEIVSLNRFRKFGYQFADIPQYFFAAQESGRPNTWAEHTISNPYVTKAKRVAAQP